MAVGFLVLLALVEGGWARVLAGLHEEHERERERGRERERTKGTNRSSEVDAGTLKPNEHPRVPW